MSFIIKHIHSADLDNICAALQASKLLKEKHLHRSRQAATEAEYLDAAQKLNLLDLKQAEILCGQVGITHRHNLFGWIYDQLTYTQERLHPSLRGLRSCDWYQSAIQASRRLATNTYTQTQAVTQFNQLFKESK